MAKDLMARGLEKLIRQQSSTEGVEHQMQLTIQIFSMLFFLMKEFRKST